MGLGVGWEVSLSEKSHPFNHGSESQQRKSAHETRVPCPASQTEPKLLLSFQGTVAMLLFSPCSQTTNRKPYCFLQWDCPYGFRVP